MFAKKFAHTKLLSHSISNTSLRVLPVRWESLVRRGILISKMETTNLTCKVDGVDHLVLTVKDMDRSIQFYTRALGMSLIQFGEGRKALQFGNQKINLHLAGKEFKPHARVPTPGSADLCFVTGSPLTEWISKFKLLSIKIEEGPVNRTGAVGPMTSVYVRDPDFNLIEIAYYGK